MRIQNSAEPAEVSEIGMHPLARVRSFSLKDRLGPAGEERVGQIMDRIRLKFEAGVVRRNEGVWDCFIALWVWHRLRLWEWDDLSQEEAVSAQFGISRGTFFNAVRSVEALACIMRIERHTIVQARYQTVWYALADVILSDDPPPITREEVIGWLVADSSAGALVREIKGVKSLPGEDYARHVVEQARGGRSALYQNGVHVVQATAFGNLDDRGIISGHDVVEEQDVVLFMPALFSYFCPCCGAEVDVRKVRSMARPRVEEV